MDIIHQISLQEQGDAEVFANIYKDKLIFDHEEKNWYIFNGHIWERDKNKRVLTLMEPIARLYESEVNKMGLQPTEGIFKFYRARINSLRKCHSIKSVLELASTHLPLTQEWDNNPYLLAVQNGVLDLKTGELRAGKPDDYIRKFAPVEWKGKEEPCERFLQFLNEIFGGNTEIVEFLQRLFGYAITGLAVEHVFPVFYGAEGRNGKDTLLKIICKVLGNDLAGPVSKEVLLSGMRNPGAAAPFLFELQGKRLVYADETSEGASFDEGQIKMISGGAPFTAKKLYMQPTTIYPEYLIVMTTNNRPKIDADDPAIWERILLVPFQQRFIENPEFENEHPVDKFLDDKLNAEKSGILAWLVKGCLEWQSRKSFDAPECVKFATDDYRSENDTVGRFIKEELIDDNEGKIYASHLYNYYEEFCIATGLQKLSKREFPRKLESRGLFKQRDAGGYYYTGISRKPTIEDEMEAYLSLVQTKSTV